MKLASASVRFLGASFPLVLWVYLKTVYLCLDNYGWVPALRGHTLRPQDLDSSIKGLEEGSEAGLLDPTPCCLTFGNPGLLDHLPLGKGPKELIPARCLEKVLGGEGPPATLPLPGPLIFQSAEGLQVYRELQNF